MKISLNGTTRDYPQDPLTVADLLEELNLGYPVLVEVNGEALFKRQFENHQLQEGDRVELIRMVAGG